MVKAKSAANLSVLGTYILQQLICTHLNFELSAHFYALLSVACLIVWYQVCLIC
jgi:hypothetical protein